MAMSLGQRYHNALEQLLPKGWAWQKRGCDDSLLGRVLRANSEELARFHVWLEQSIKASIERFIEVPQGWSAPDYERLLLTKFGIQSTVTDGLLPYSCESLCVDPLLDERIIYVYVITVGDVGGVPANVLSYLREYQQSHTHYHLRDRALQVSETQTILPLTLGNYDLVTVTHEATEAEKAVANDPLNETTWTETYWDYVGGVHCESPIHVEDYHYIDIASDWTYPASEIPQMPGFAAIMQNLPPRTLLSFNR